MSSLYSCIFFVQYSLRWGLVCGVFNTDRRLERRARTLVRTAASAFQIQAARSSARAALPISFRLDGKLADITLPKHTHGICVVDDGTDRRIAGVLQLHAPV